MLVEMAMVMTVVVDRWIVRLVFLFGGFVALVVCTLAWVVIVALAMPVWVIRDYNTLLMTVRAQ